MKTYIDLSHTIKNGEVTYKGLPVPFICDYLSRADSKERYDDESTFQIDQITMVGNTGTYIDCPFHRYEDGKDLADTPIQQFTDLPGVLIEARYSRGVAIGPAYFADVDIKGKAVLVHTSWSDHWQTDLYYEHHPYITKAGAEYLRDAGALLVGIDSHNIDDTRGGGRPVHRILLKQGILIVEHMNNLKALKNKEFTFTAVPPKIEAMGTFPVRAFATIIQ